MTDVFAFVKGGIASYSLLNVPDFTSDVFQICNALNNLLNKNVSDGYEEHIENNSYVIEELIKNLFSCFSDKLYLNLAEVFDLLKWYQQNSQISKDKYRDHYYHSVQCFLLSLSLYAQASLFSNHRKNSEKDFLTTIFFSLFIYHDLGYLYFSENKERINNTIRSWLIGIEVEENPESENYKTSRICKILNIQKEENIISELSKGEELNKIWNQPINYADECIIQEKFEISNTSAALKKHHSYESAVLLYRFVRTLDYYSSSLIAGDVITSQNKQRADFLDIIRAILLHDFNISAKINIENDFLACILMIVDEMQNYGRLYQNKNYNKYVILPAKIGIKLSKKDKVQIVKDVAFVDSLDEDIKKKYDGFTTERIYDILKDKIQRETLDELFDC